MPSDQLAPGTRLADWTIERRLGEGGMALVYLARFDRLRRTDVLKVMRPWLAADPAFRARFAAEAQLMCDWRHPHVVTVYDQREQDGLLFIAMQYVPHGDPRAVLKRDARLPVGRALGVAAQLADALDSGHELGLVHRDLKPDNVLLQRWAPGRDHVLLGDFGISRSTAADAHLTQTGQLLLSPAYAAPEQLGLMVRFLHHDHTAEDERVWPRLRERDPSAAAVLDRLESEHAAIDPLVSVIGDRSIPLPDRAPQLQELSDLLNAHLDGEEAEAVPLIRTLISAEEWDADAEEILAGIKKDMPMIMGTASSIIDAGEVDAFLDDVPRIVRILWRLVWRRQWEKRNRLVHGS